MNEKRAKLDRNKTEHKLSGRSSDKRSTDRRPMGDRQESDAGVEDSGATRLASPTDAKGPEYPKSKLPENPGRRKTPPLPPEPLAKPCKLVKLKVDAENIFISLYSKKEKGTIPVEMLHQGELSRTIQLDEDKPKRKPHYFMDPNKQPTKFWLTFEFLEGYKEPSSKNPKTYCWWCKHPFNNYPLPCPVAILDDRTNLEKDTPLAQTVRDILESSPEWTDTAARTTEGPMSQTSETHPSSDEMSTAYISPTASTDAHTKSTATAKKHKQEVYISDGVYCSYPCAAAYISDNSHNPRYINSMSLLYQIYWTNTKRNDDIPYAPDWRLLKVFGGHLDIDEFRDGLGNVEYQSTINFIVSSRVYYERR